MTCVVRRQGIEHGYEMFSRDPARHSVSLSGRNVRRLPASLRRAAGAADAPGGPGTVHHDRPVRAVLQGFGYRRHDTWRLSDAPRSAFVHCRDCLSVHEAALLLITDRLSSVIASCSVAQPVAYYSVVKYGGGGRGQSGQAAKLFQITPYINDFQTLNNPGS